MYAKFILTIFLVTSLGCGKPPLLNRLSNVTTLDQLNELKQEKFPQLEKTFALKWQVLPNVESLSAVDIYFTAPLAEEYSVEAEIVMRDHGHGSSPIVIEYNQTRSIVKLTELSFFMTGRWTLILTLKEHNQIVDQWEEDIYL